MFAKSSKGFSLIELILVILLIGVLAAALVVFLRPALDNFAAARGRSTNVSAADAALFQLSRDVRRAVPNSLRGPGTNCIEMVPTVGGGRYRMAEGTPGDGSAALDTTTSASSFDVLGELAGRVSPQDWVVVGNQGVADIYGGSSRAQISAVTGSPGGGAHGTLRIAHAAKQFPQGYAGGRFMVVSNSERAVTYVCVSPGVLSNGNGSGTLYRLVNYGFNAAYPTTCPGAGGEVLVRNVSACNFSLSSVAQTEYGLLTVLLSVTTNGETYSLFTNEQVSNLP